MEITVSKIYKHYKGNLYKVIALAKHSETCEEMVIYQSIKTNEVWARPKKMWFETVNEEGTLRFSEC